MMFSDTANDVGDADLIVYMCHEEMAPGWQTVGIAYGGVNCDSSWANKYKQSINEWRSSAAAYGGLLAHEIGHNLGMLMTSVKNMEVMVIPIVVVLVKKPTIS